MENPFVEFSSKRITIRTIILACKAIKSFIACLKPQQQKIIENKALMVSQKAELSFVQEIYRIRIDVSFLHKTHINNMNCNLLKNHHQRNI